MRSIYVRVDEKLVEAKDANIGAFSSQLASQGLRLLTTTRRRKLVLLPLQLST